MLENYYGKIEKGVTNLLLRVSATFACGMTVAYLPSRRRCVFAGGKCILNRKGVMTQGNVSGKLVGDQNVIIGSDISTKRTGRYTSGEKCYEPFL